MTVPIALFVYNRPDTLTRTLDALQTDNVPLLYIFSDAPKRPAHDDGVQQVRDLIHRIDWTETHIIERESNYGLGRSILSGVSHVLEQHEAIIVFEDDLICAPGTYRYFSDVLQHYRDESRVMSITAWNNTELIPKGVTAPYLDGRAESWTWATWRRAWHGLNHTDAMTLLHDYRRSDRDVRRYGEDVPAMALMEAERNLWLVRWILWHLVNDGLCLRPPHTMVEHIGYGTTASNAPDS
ncbi:MAG: glycosyltransferase [Chloroflexota bacterium]